MEINLSLEENFVFFWENKSGEIDIGNINRPLWTNENA